MRPSHRIPASQSPSMGNVSPNAFSNPNSPDRDPSQTRSGDTSDAADIMFCLTRYWNSIDLNRVPDVDMDRFVASYPQAAQAWSALKERYEN